MRKGGGYPRYFPLLGLLFLAVQRATFLQHDGKAQINCARKVFIVAADEATSIRERAG
jgi:hypothetical protein